MKFMKQVLMINILFLNQYVCGEGTFYSKIDSFTCYSMEKFNVDQTDESICASACEELETKVCVGFRLEQSNCELCLGCPETVAQNITLFLINYQEELDKGTLVEPLEIVTFSHHYTRVPEVEGGRGGGRHPAL